MRAPMCTCGHSVFAHPSTSGRDWNGPCIHAGCRCDDYEPTAPDLTAALRDSLDTARRQP